MAFLAARPALQAQERSRNIIPLSGPSASVGEQGKDAGDMAAEEINAEGGVKSLGLAPSSLRVFLKGLVG